MSNLIDRLLSSIPETETQKRVLQALQTRKLGSGVRLLPPPQGHLTNEAFPLPIQAVPEEKRLDMNREAQNESFYFLRSSKLPLQRINNMLVRELGLK